MKTDIFEDMKERVGCENISDLPTVNVRCGKSSSSTPRLPIQRNNWKNSVIMCSV